MKKLKVLYISIVDWNWIKQRPQIIAEELAKYFEVYVIYPKFYRNRNLTNNSNNNSALTLHQRIKVPYSARIGLLKKIDNYFNKETIKRYIKKEKPDVLYISHPDDYSQIIQKYSNFVIYDCMDNYSEFETNNKRRKNLLFQEKKICERANCILVSSMFLFNKILSYGVEKEKIHLVRNGYAGSVLITENSESRINHNKSPKKITYFGTVGPWFDFQLLEESLGSLHDVEYHIAGPVDRDMPYNERIIYDGIIPHDSLYEYVKDADVLIMPFIINNIVEAVDPVKLYEYINFDKPIVSVFYDEINRFRDFVSFYSDLESFVDAIIDACNKGKKYNDSQRLQFLSDNTWNKRGELIASIIEAEV